MHIVWYFFLFLYVNTYKMSTLSDFVKMRRKQYGFTQQEFADKAGVALTVIRKIEQGKENLSMSKVNQVLHLFGHILGPIQERHASGNR